MKRTRRRRRVRVDRGEHISRLLLLDSMHFAQLEWNLWHRIWDFTPRNAFGACRIAHCNTFFHLRGWYERREGNLFMRLRRCDTCPGFLMSFITRTSINYRENKNNIKMNTVEIPTRSYGWWTLDSEKPICYFLLELLFQHSERQVLDQMVFAASYDGVKTGSVIKGIFKLVKKVRAE